jgi:hypothetical protein
MKVEIRPLNEIYPYPKNARKISGRARSIKWLHRSLSA